MESNFDFLNDYIPKDKVEKKETESLLTPDDIQTLKEEEAVDNLKNSMSTEQKEEYEETERSFKKMDMAVVKWSTVEKTKFYNCVIVNRQLMGQDGMPLAYSRKLQAETIEIAKENGGHLVRADKGMPDFLRVNNLTDCDVVLVHRAKSLKQILEQQRRDNWTKSEKEKIPKQVTVVYSNSTVRNFTLKADPKDRSETIDQIFELLTMVKPPEHEPISVFEDNKFVVFPAKYIFGVGNLVAINAIGVIERAINEQRDKEGKPPIAGNKYFVCNQDEPYAQEVLKVILKGEDNKLHNQ